MPTFKLDVFLIYRDGSTFYATLEDANLRLPSDNFNATTKTMLLAGKIITSKLKITTTEQQLASAVLKEDENNAYILADKILEERDPPPGFVTRKELEQQNYKLQQEIDLLKHNMQIREDQNSKLLDELQDAEREASRYKRKWVNRDD